MQVTVPPRSTETQDDRDLSQRVAALEALIEEARKRARRRRQRNGAVVLLVAAGGIAALIGFGRHGGGTGSAATARAPGSQGATAHAESPPLGALPPDAGTVESFAFHPRNPSIVYVLTISSPFAGGGHVFKTIDGGAHWRATANRGWMGSKDALTVDPQHPSILYAGTERAVYKTVDGGKSWRPSKRGLFAPPRPYQFNRAKGWVVALAVDRGNASFVYAGSDRVSKSTDGGRSWKTVFPSHLTRYPGDTVSALVIAPTHLEAIYAITGDFSSPSPTPARGRTSIYKSTDAGKTWHATTVVRGSVAPTALAVDPRHPTTVYAAIGAKVLKTTDAGETWQPIADGLPITDTRGSCHCLSLGGVRALAVDPRRTGTVYAALTQGGVYKTTNGGRTWTRSFGDVLFDRYTVAVDPARPATIYAAGEDEAGSRPRILRSTDSGQTWTIAG